MVSTGEVTEIPLEPSLVMVVEEMESLATCDEGSWVTIEEVEDPRGPSLARPDVEEVRHRRTRGHGDASIHSHDKLRRMGALTALVFRRVRARASQGEAERSIGADHRLDVELHPVAESRPACSRDRSAADRGCVVPSDRALVP